MLNQKKKKTKATLNVSRKAKEADYQDDNTHQVDMLNVSGNLVISGTVRNKDGGIAVKMRTVNSTERIPSENVSPRSTSINKWKQQTDQPPSYMAHSPREQNNMDFINKVADESVQEITNAKMRFGTAEHNDSMQTVSALGKTESKSDFLHGDISVILKLGDIEKNQIETHKITVKAGKDSKFASMRSPMSINPGKQQLEIS